MNRSSRLSAYGRAALLARSVFATPLIADRHGHKEHHRKHQQTETYREDENDDDDRHSSGEHHFNDTHRSIVREYDDELRDGRCPPGLAKKRNGATTWTCQALRVGRPLPGNVTYFDLPPRIIQQIGYPPAGYRYVRVASDILLIAIGTGMVMDALIDLNGR